MKVRSVVIFILSLIVFGFGYLVVTNVIDINASTFLNIKGEDLGKGNKIEQIVDGNIFFLLVGVDKNDEGSGKEQDENVRTDTMMLVNVDTNNGAIQIVSIPRDIKVDYNGNQIKINEAHSIDNMKGTLKAVRELTGLDVDYYMSVDYDAVSRIVDAVGGVEVDSPVVMDLPDIGVYIPQGKSKLNGKQALYFVRAREILPMGSDIERMDNQQYFMKQLMKSVLKLSNITKIGSIIDVYKDNVDTNLDLGYLGKVALKALDFDEKRMVTETLPFFEGDKNEDRSYLYVNEEEMIKLFKKLFPKEYFLDSSMYNGVDNNLDQNNNGYNEGVENNYNNGNDYNNYNDVNNNYNNGAENYNNVDNYNAENYNNEVNNGYVEEDQYNNEGELVY